MKKGAARCSLLVAMLVLLTASVSSSAIYYKAKTTSSKKKTIIPTVFMHGYKGTFNSFGHMLNRLGYDYQDNNAAMRILVLTSGKLKVSGTLLPGDKGNSAIQVLFQDNRASLAKQTNWLHKVMHYLRVKHNVENVNVVGHSMGGLALLSYLEDTPAKSKRYPKIHKFVAIASPFEGIDKADYFKLQKDPAAHDLKKGSDALQALVKNKDKIPTDIKMLAIAGKQGKTDSDGLVRVDSVFFVKNIFPRINYQQRLVKGNNITHSGLHENLYVDRYTSQFLWNLPDGFHQNNKNSFQNGLKKRK